MAASMTTDTTNNRFVFTDDLISQNGYVVTFNTANKFVDKNIRVEIGVDTGTISPYFDNTNLSTYFNNGTSGNNSISITPKATSTAGFINTLTTSNAQTGTASYYTIKSGVAGANTASAEITKTSTDDSSKGGQNIGSILGTRVNAEPTSGYFISLQASGSGSSKINTAGWMTEGALTAASTTVERFFPVTAAVGTVTGTNTVSPTASLSGSNVTLSDTNNGISITATGGGTASVTASANITTAGYAPSGNGFASATLNASSNTTTATKYISAITIPSNKSLTITNNGTATITTSGTANITNTGTTTVTSGSATAGNLTVSAYNASGDAENNKSIVSNGEWVSPSVSASGTYYGRVTINSGAIEGVSSDPGTGFATNTTSVPAGGWLKLTAGYYPATKISLSSLVPDASAVEGLSANYILSGHSAYDNTGTLINGSIVTYTGAYEVG